MYMCVCVCVFMYLFDDEYTCMHIQIYQESPKIKQRVHLHGSGISTL